MSLRPSLQVGGPLPGAVCENQISLSPAVTCLQGWPGPTLVLALELSRMFWGHCAPSVKEGGFALLYVSPSVVWAPPCRWPVVSPFRCDSIRLCRVINMVHCNADPHLRIQSSPRPLPLPRGLTRTMLAPSGTSGTVSGPWEGTYWCPLTQEWEQRHPQPMIHGPLSLSWWGAPPKCTHGV